MSTHEAGNFLRPIIAAHQESGEYGGRVVTRFPPEPNGYLHIGHAKAICVDFGMAREFGGACNLRFDDTNPLKEDAEFVRSIEGDVRWLGFEWDSELHASDYFDFLYDKAELLVRKGLAFVCSQDEEAMRAARGTVTEAGTPSPDRDRPVDDNLDLLRRMRDGEFPDGAYTLRAKIDMASPNMKMRDPALYRIRHATHHRSGDRWSIYPMYDYAHCLSDSKEGITHSICTLEFENNRELYDWILAMADVPQPPPRQYEMARLELTHTITSKRKLKQLVDEGRVSGWDDTRMPTIAGLRRLGVPPRAIVQFCDRIGVAKTNSTVEIEVLEASVRDVLNDSAPRALAVLRPLKVVITNYPQGTEELELPRFPQRDDGELRAVPFGRELFIERDDFMEEPEPGFKRLAPGREVRLRGAWLITCDEVIKGASGEVVELRCSYDPATRGGDAPDGRKVSGTLHWVAAHSAVDAEVRLYDRLFSAETPGADGDFLADLNPASLRVLSGCKLEPALAGVAPGDSFQFERLGYFAADLDSRPGALVFNRVVSLRSSLREDKREAARGKGRDVDAELSALGAAADLARALVDRGVALDRVLALSRDDRLRGLLDAALAIWDHPLTLADFISSRVAPLLDNAAEGSFTGASVAWLAEVSRKGELSNKALREVLARPAAEGGDARTVAEALGLAPSEADAGVIELVRGVLGGLPDEVARYRGGDRRLMGFFVGQVMRAARGKAQPAQVKAALAEVLDA